MLIKKAQFIKSSKGLEDAPPESLPEYAFIGRSNVGKSSLINLLTEQKNLAKTSASPGKTQLINHFEINEAWNLVDLPGYGYAKVSKKMRNEFKRMIYNYLEKRKSLIATFVLLDARHEPMKADLDFMQWLGIKQIPFVMVFTKIDKIDSSALRKNLNAYRNKMLETWEFLPDSFTTSAVSQHGRDEILNYIDHINTDLANG
ncbi:ribosome biogenesis GTP-binding protein YihA/YsxC [Salibacter sp.]|uniref:ribosome biogenesis GTP-binding protein YihA/YsxC n=1 Tax=Salibacter sp. TaxID=2010995 RepID=UPI002870340F|nr:ribosome biogenesis GTP-binding protein YihA/YsxC [Salibacter sp.]MDR9398340.1 ribosome biogenesis GTP-binding protein YihA/YsxC [Salibacter sp.]MDR9487586.1 ribosome biogenesis GTP-binding protein YihA/YsxC [Salibacter sp.]